MYLASCVGHCVRLLILLILLFMLMLCVMTVDVYLEPEASCGGDDSLYYSRRMSLLFVMTMFVDI